MKRKIVTMLVIVFSFMIAFGGMFFMQKKLQHQEEKILSEKLNEKVKIFRENSDEEQEQTKTALTEDELVEIVQSMKNGKNMIPHEPQKGQLSIEKAVNKGKEWAENTVTTKKQIYEKVSATLCRNDAVGINDISDKLYS